MISSDTHSDINNIPPSPIQELQSALFREHDVRVFVKRDDLIHPSVQGNKWRKLKYNILKIKELGISEVMTFGGAFSNHIHATAAAGKLYGFNTIGIIRGECTTPLSSTLVFAINCGMKLHFVSRVEFKDKNTLAAKMQENSVCCIYLLPEGGTNELALNGCQEIVKEVNLQLPFKVDYFVTACGTGGTVSGIIKATDNSQKVLGISVLKGDFLGEEVAKLINYNNNQYDIVQKNQPFCEKTINWEILTDYHFGGYAKYDLELLTFINNFKTEFDIQLDPVYTGKMFYALFDKIKKGYFPKGSCIVAVHTGGLQGIEGFNDVKLKGKNKII